MAVAKITKTTMTLTSATETTTTHTTIAPTSSFLISSVASISDQKNKFKALLAFR
jgi:hypothetical protein